LVNKKMFWGCIFCILILCSLFIVGITDVVYAQPHGNHYRYGVNHNQIIGGSYGELGKLTGWGAVVMLFCATFPCIMRRIVSTRLLNNDMNSKSSFWRFLKRNHYIAGTLALILTILHGAIMITGRHGGFVLWIGITSGILMLITIFGGVSLLKQQNNTSLLLRQGHVVFSLFLIILAIIHII